MNNKIDIGHAGANFACAEKPDFIPQKVRVSIFIAALGLCLIFCVPTMLLSQWFPLDFAGILNQNNFDDWMQRTISPYYASGRYLPFYWVYYITQTYLFGTNITPCFIIQSILFLASSLLACRILYQLTGRYGLVLLFLLLFYFNTPMAENVNTMGKPEPLICFFILCILADFCCYPRVTPRFFTAKDIGIGLLYALCLWTKETSGVLIGFALTGLVVSGVLGKWGKLEAYEILAKKYCNLLLSLLFGLGLTKIPYLISIDPHLGAAYTDYSLTLKLIKENVFFYATQQPDVLFFGLLATSLAAFAGKKLFFGAREYNQLHARNYIFALSLCAMGWAYYLGLLIWRWPMAYYMLLPSLMFKLCALYGMYLTDLYEHGKKLVRRIIHGMIALCIIYSAFYSYYITTTQIAYSRIYTEALQRFVSLDVRAPLIIESYPFYSEHIGGTQMLLSHFTHTRFEVRGIYDVVDPEATRNKEIMKLLHVTQADVDKNTLNIPKHGDYLLVFDGSKLATWFLRGVTPYFSRDSLLKQQGAYDMELVSEDKIYTRALFVNTWTFHPNFDKTYIGYKLYKIVSNEPKFLWRGRYPDGWMPAHATLLVNPLYNRPVSIKFSAPAILLPQRITVFRDGQVFKTIDITDINERQLTLENATGKPVTYTFNALKTFVPEKKSYGT